MNIRIMPIVVVFFLALFAAGGWYTDRQMKEHTITITEQDVVRYCLDSRRAKLGDKDEKFYCKDMGGDEFMAKGFKPNYDKFPSDKMFTEPAKH